MFEDVALKKLPNLQPHLTVMIRPTDICNLKCRYCYGEGNSKKIMSIKTLENIYHQLDIVSNHININHINIIWHGAEPLTAGISFFKHAMNIQKKYKTQFLHSIQTNGTLINNEWAKLFLKHMRSVGISLDGPKDIHDKNRIHSDDSGSFNKVINAYKILKSFNIPVTHICVITKYSLNRENDIFNFFKEMGMDFIRFNPVSLPTNHEYYIKLKISGTEYTYFMHKLFNLWKNDKKQEIHISNFTNTAEALLRGRSISCMSNIEKSQYFIAIDTDGSIYPCNRLVLKEYKIGNITEKSLISILKEYTPCKIITKCHGCRYLPICGGGCYHETLLNNGNEYPYCNYRKMVISEVYYWIVGNKLGCFQ